MSHCPRCGAGFECGMMAGHNEQPCWCTQLPPLPADSYVRNQDDAGASRCFCPQCLRALLNAAEAAPQKSR